MNNDLSSYFEDPEFKELLARYEGMVESHTPTYFDAEELTDIAEYYASQGEERKTEEVIDFALRLHPTNTDALVFKSRSLCIKGKLDEAYQVMNLIEDPSDREVQFLKADLLMEERRLEEAEAIYQALAQSEDESLEVLMDIFMTYMDLNLKEYAARWLKKIEEKGYNETNSQKYRDALCDYCMTFGEPEKATNAFQLSLDEKPYSLIHWNGMAKCYLAQNDTEKALDAVEFALAIEENNPDALEVKAFCYTQTENLDEAIAIYKQLLPQSKTPSRIYAMMSKCYLDMEKAVEAKEICLKWLKECPKMSTFEKSEVYSYISLCCFNLQQPEEGMKYIDAALNLEPSFRGAMLQKGMMHLQMDNSEEAEKLFQKVMDISMDDEQSEVLYNVANSYFFLQMYPQVIEWCEKIIQGYPDEQMEALYLTACSYFHMLDIETSMKYLTQIWKLSNNNFEKEYLNDKRFKHMFEVLETVLRKQMNNPN
ncbi:MAG: tetratricopeptide repeat protein [Bacteroides sp.]|nr:tetratricopeptide repeat protein [Bacteroides sp.]